MKKINKIISVLLSFILILMSVSSVAAEVTTQTSPVLFDYDREAQYEFLQNWKDPDDYTDEQLFGKYNTGVFTNGFLDYDRFPEMEAIKNAVIAGDYSLAKEELLEYYRYKFLGITAVTNKYDAFDRKDLLTNYLMEYDMAYNGNSGIIPLNIFTISDKRDWYSIDIMDNITSMINEQESTVFLVALKKDGSVAGFDSRTGSNPPYMELTINGVTQKLYATDVTYISPCENAAAIYGSQPAFMVEESVSSIGIIRDANFKTLTKPGAPVDKNTKRGYLKFNVSDIPNNAVVTAASIKLYGSNTGTQGDMEIAAFKMPLNDWCEGGYTYNGTALGMSYYKSVNPIKDSQGNITGTTSLTIDNQTIFSYYGEGSFGYVWGRAYDQYTGGYSTYYRHHEDILRMSFFFPHAARLYNASKENNDHYASVGIRQWAGFLQERGGNSTYTHQLDFGVRTRAVIYGLKYMIQSEHMTPDIWSATVKYMWRSGTVLNSITTGLNNNVRTFQAAGLATVNAYFNEFSAHYAWANKLRGLTSSNMSAIIRADGSNLEGAIGYGIYALDDMISWVNPNVEAGITDKKSESLEQGLSGPYGERLKKGFKYLLDMVGPGYVDNQTGDGSSHKNSFTGVFKRGYDALGDLTLLYAATKGKEGKNVDTTSSMYTDGKVAVMRTGWESDAAYLYTDVSPNTSHLHNSQNNIIMFANGKYLLTDQLYYTYTSSTAPDSIYRRIRSVRMHNTVEIENSSLTTTGVTTNANGSVNNWATNDAFDISNMTTPVNSNANHTRNIVFIKPGFFIVSDYLTPKTSVTSVKNYKQHWHLLPTANLTLDTETGTARTNFSGESNLVIAQADADGMVSSIQSDGLYSEGGGNLTSQVDYLRYEKDRTGNVVFDTLLIPEPHGENIEVTTERLTLSDVVDNGAVAMSFEISNNNQNTVTHGSYYLVNDSAQKAIRRFGDYQADSNFAYVEKDKSAKLTRLFIQNGKSIIDKASDIELLKAAVNLTDVGIEYSPSTINISSGNPDFDLTKLTFYTDRTISTVNYNGVPTNFKQKGAYIYFGENPIIDDDTVIAPTPTPTPSKPSIGGNSHGSSGGSVSGGAVIKPGITPAPDKGGNKSGFTDLSEAEWAKEYIIELEEKQIVSGDGSGKFFPNKNVTREEYIKMLSLALGIEPMYNDELPFMDVPNDSWAYPYITAAYKNGIITGTSEDIFGFGQLITREDMAVITVRILDKFEIHLESEHDKTDFADILDISSYAVESARRMQQYGIINGDGNGYFNPKNAATRAESAKVICILLKRVGQFRPTLFIVSV